jgi:hypothetical protein
LNVLDVVETDWYYSSDFLKYFLKFLNIKLL